MIAVDNSRAGNDNLRSTHVKEPLTLRSCDDGHDNEENQHVLRYQYTYRIMMCLVSSTVKGINSCSLLLYILHSRLMKGGLLMEGVEGEMS
jgi:hypothetical protein